MTLGVISWRDEIWEFWKLTAASHPQQKRVAWVQRFERSGLSRRESAQRHGLGFVHLGALASLSRATPHAAATTRSQCEVVAGPSPWLSEEQILHLLQSSGCNLYPAGLFRSRRLNPGRQLAFQLV